MFHLLQREAPTLTTLRSPGYTLPLQPQVATGIGYGSAFRRGLIRIRYPFPCRVPLLVGWLGQTPDIVAW